MVFRRFWLLTLLAISFGACDCGGECPDDDAGLDASRDSNPPQDGDIADGNRADGELSDGAIDGSTSDGGEDASTSDGGSMDGATDATVMDAAPDAPPPPCVPATCGGRTYQCGNCLDDDGDGLEDSLDPDCLGACDNNEAGYDLGIPGGEVGRCARDCYYDTNQGRGNDDCVWDSRCDPLGPGIGCDYIPPEERPASVDCPVDQSDTCVDVCRSVTPNGCDCFGCCELPARSGNFVFLGSTDEDGNPTCTPDGAEDPELCNPCTPVMGVCNNPCGRCEICLGETAADLPADCFPPPPGPEDAGVPDGGSSDGGTADAGRDGSVSVDGGVTPPDPRCPDGDQPCSGPGDDPCPTGFYCQTGCCVLFI